MDRARVQIWFSSYFFHSPAPRFPDLVTSQQKWCSDKHVIIAQKHDCECISWFMGTINILKVVRACLIAWNLGFNSLCLYIFFNFLLFFQFYYFSILLFFQFYYFFDFILPKKAWHKIFATFRHKNQHFWIPIRSRMLERLIHDPLAREIGQPLLTLSSLNKINLI